MVRDSARISALAADHLAGAAQEIKPLNKANAPTYPPFRRKLALRASTNPGLVVAHGLSQAQWVSRFVDKLASVQPDLDSAEVLALITTAYRDAGDLDPELAADVYTRDLPSGDKGGA